MISILELPLHILNTPNFTSGIGALRAALRLSPSTVRESTGSITPSSHSLQNSIDTVFKYCMILFHIWRLCSITRDTEELDIQDKLDRSQYYKKINIPFCYILLKTVNLTGKRIRCKMCVTVLGMFAKL
jgi:hypothetical protein